MGVFYVEPEKVAEGYGIEVVADETLGEDIYGYGRVDDNGKGKIGYNPKMPERKIRFTVAHVLGHFLLGHFAEEKEFMEKHDNFDSEAPVLEDEANMFALELLIPKDKVEFLIYGKGITSPKEIANILKVSEVALVHMLKKYSIL